MRAVLCALLMLSSAVADPNVPGPTSGGFQCRYDAECGGADLNSRYHKRTTQMPTPIGPDGGRCVDGVCKCSVPMSVPAITPYIGCDNCVENKCASTYKACIDVINNPKSEFKDFAWCHWCDSRDGVHSDRNMCSEGAGSGKKSCRVGVCHRNADDLIQYCDGDFQCSRQINAGLCVGPDGGDGTCACVEGYSCDDCSLNVNDDMLFYARCGVGPNTYKRGQAQCDTSRPDKGVGQCNQQKCNPAVNQLGIGAPEKYDNLGWCQCDAGMTCGRCTEKKADVMAQPQKARCEADVPVFTPNEMMSYNRSGLDIDVHGIFDFTSESTVYYYLKYIDADGTSDNLTVVLPPFDENGRRLKIHFPYGSDDCNVVAWAGLPGWANSSTATSGPFLFRDDSDYPAGLGAWIMANVGWMVLVCVIVFASCQCIRVCFCQEQQEEDRQRLMMAT